MNITLVYASCRSIAVTLRSNRMTLVPASCWFIDHLNVFYQRGHTVNLSGANPPDFVIILRVASRCGISALRYHQFTENQLAKAEQIVQLRPHILYIFFRASSRFFYDTIQDSHLKSAKIYECVRLAAQMKP